MKSTNTKKFRKQQAEHLLHVRIVRNTGDDRNWKKISGVSGAIKLWAEYGDKALAVCDAISAHWAVKMYIRYLLDITK